MRVADLPLDTWVVIEPLSSGEFNLLSTHDTQGQAEAERDDRNRGLQTPRYSAVIRYTPSTMSIVPATIAPVSVSTPRRNSPDRSSAKIGAPSRSAKALPKLPVPPTIATFKEFISTSLAKEILRLRAKQLPH